MKRAHIQYPYLPGAVEVYSSNKGVVTFGAEKPQGISTVYTATAIRDLDTASMHSHRVLRLEPPIVEPWAYTETFERGPRVLYTFAPTAHGADVIYRHGIPPAWPALPDTPNRIPWAERAPAVVAVMGDKYPGRRVMLDNIAAQGIQLEVYGNPGFDRPWYRGPIPGGAEEKRRVLSGYRFCLCPENDCHPRYMTEKLPDALVSGCFPIYWGASKNEYPSIPWAWVSSSLMLEQKMLGEDANTHEAFLETVARALPAIKAELSMSGLYEQILADTP